MKENIKKIIGIIIILGLILSITFNILIIRKNDNPKIISENIEEKIEKLAELSTIKYNYTDVVSYENNKQFNGINIPFTSKKFIVKYSGYVKAGTNLEDIEYEINNKDIEVNLKKTEILDNVINEEDVLFFDEKNGIFNKLKYDDLMDLLVEEKKRTATDLVTNGLLEEANMNLEEILGGYLRDLGFESVVINFSK